ncbi:MAG TPA: 50S ribosomal protein L3 [Candidatus Nanoarchaeia archaeon]|nr:50S ribosomal protein L3 [Candidatus Nanoarchaeia archaeon]
MQALIGRKIGMTQLFDDDGNVARITVIEAGPCTITQVKKTETDGYNAIQIGFGQAKKPNRPLMGHLKAANAASDVLREIRIKDIQGDAKDAGAEAEEATEELAYEVGQTLDVSNFEIGDKVTVTATSKGKGFAGTIKRHNFSRGPKTHGSHNYRAPGSIGAGYPEHVMKGMRMAGQMGNEQVTTKNLKVMLVDKDKNLLGVRGAVPGARRSVVIIRGSNG